MTHTLTPSGNTALRAAPYVYGGILVYHDLLIMNASCPSRQSRALMSIQCYLVCIKGNCSSRLVPLYHSFILIREGEYA